jgi:hypothetical protein
MLELPHMSLRWLEMFAAPTVLQHCMLIVIDFESVLISGVTF